MASERVGDMTLDELNQLIDRAVIGGLIWLHHHERAQWMK